MIFCTTVFPSSEILEHIADDNDYDYDNGDDNDNKIIESRIRIVCVYLHL